MVSSKQLNNKLKSTPKMSLRTRQVSMHDQSTPCFSATNFNDEEFLEMIRKIVKEGSKNHEEKVGEIIKTQLENTNNRLDSISQEVVDITESLEFTQEQLDEELAKLKNDVGKIQTDIKYIEDDLLDPEHVMKKLTELEDRSRRNNLRIDGVEETSKETWDICEGKVQDIVKNKLGITAEIEFDRCHRTGKFKKNQAKLRAIVCIMLRFKDKEKNFQNSKKLKNMGTFIYEDFCKETMELRKSLWKEVLEHRRQIKIAYLNYRWVVVRDRR